MDVGLQKRKAGLVSFRVFLRPLKEVRAGRYKCPKQEMVARHCAYAMPLPMGMLVGGEKIGANWRLRAESGERRAGKGNEISRRRVANSLYMHYASQIPGKQGVETAYDEAECALVSALWYIGVLNGPHPAHKAGCRGGNKRDE